MRGTPGPSGVAAVDAEATRKRGRGQNGARGATVNEAARKANWTRQSKEGARVRSDRKYQNELLEKIRAKTGMDIDMDQALEIARSLELQKSEGKKFGRSVNRWIDSYAVGGPFSSVEGDVLVAAQGEEWRHE